MTGRVKVIMAALTVLAALSALWWVWTPAVAQQPAAPAAPAATRVGYVDLQRILARSQAGVQAREQIEKEKAAMQKQVDSQKVDYDKLRDELEKKGQLLSADARREKQEALERKTRDIRRLLDDLEKELQKKEQTMGQKILRDLEGIFTKVGKEKGYAVIVERRQAGVVYGAPEVDVTEDVIKAFDDEMRKAKK
jgi:outer membrane protein